MASASARVWFVCLFSGLLLQFQTPANAAVTRFGPFGVEDSVPSVILLVGEIDGRSALDFRRALRAAPDAETLVMDSPGGNVATCLLIADDIHQRKMATVITPQGICYSACAFIFFAGVDRVAMGKLGVHQISSDRPDLEFAQLAISDIIDALVRFGTPTEVLTIMFRTPAQSMHVFSEQELREFGINRTIPEVAVDQRRRLGSGPSKKFTQRLTPDAGEQDGNDNDSAVPGPTRSPPYDRVPGLLSSPQRLVFYEERLGELPGEQQDGRVAWSYVDRAATPGQPPSPTIIGTARIPNEQISMRMAIRRNFDPALPASHVIEIEFWVPPEFSGGSIADIQRLAFKPTEAAKGEPLIGVAGKLSRGRFLIALNDLEAAVSSNLKLMKEEEWIDIPIAYATGRRALISIEKGEPGRVAFEKAVSAWAESATSEEHEGVVENLGIKARRLPYAGRQSRP